MKSYKMIALLVAIALLMMVSACTRQASTSPIATPTAANGEVPFPVDTEEPGDVNDLATQTAVANGPQEMEPTSTPEVLVATPESGDPDQGGGQGEGQAAPQAPEATTAPAVATPVVVRPATYTLERGEWPICIARRFNLDMSTFLSMNNMNMNSKPGAGTTMRVPETGTWNTAHGSRSLRTHPTDYVVVSGDTVNSVACKFGDVTPEAIIAVNNLQSGSLTPGTTIRIP